jgi:hypothetical protein
MPEPEQDIKENMPSNKSNGANILSVYLKRNAPLRNGREVSPAGDKRNAED